jgi:hypothetical protein
MRISQPLFKYSKNWVSDVEMNRSILHSFQKGASSDSESNNTYVWVGRLRGQINLELAL